MRKLILSAIMVLALSGCSMKTDYEKLVDDLKGVKSMDQAMMEVGIDTTNLSLNYTVESDLDSSITHINVLGLDVYTDNEYVYTKMLGSWYKTALTEEEKADLKEEFNIDVFTMEFPEGDEVISNVDSGVEKIDTALNNKTYNDVFVATENGYSIVGLEDLVAITVEDNKLNFEFSGSETDGKMHIMVGEAEAVELPSEANDAKEISQDQLNALES